MHSVLEQQIKEHFGSLDRVPEKWRSFIAAVDETYRQNNAGLAELVDAQGRVLLDAIQSAALGELDVQIEVPEGVEVLSDLAIGLDMMIDDIREMITEQVQARKQMEQTHHELDMALQQVLAVQRRYIHEGWERYVQEQERVSDYALIDGQPASSTDISFPAMASAIANGEMASDQDDQDSTLALPIQFYGELLGVLGFAREGQDGWSENELSTVRAVLDQVAQALENQRLLDEQQRVSTLMGKRVEELACLSDIGRKLDESPSLVDLLTWVAARIPAAMQHADECLVAIEFGGQVYGKPEAQTLPRQMVQGMRISGELVGRVYVAYTQDYDFLDEESALLGDVARRLSGYIEVQQLLHDAQARAEQERQVRTAVDRIRRAVDTEAVMRVGLEELNQVLGTSRLVLRLGVPGRLPAGSEQPKTVSGKGV